MSDFSHKFDQATARVNKTVGETAEKLEKEAADLIKYLNDEVVPAVRQGSTKVLRTAAEKLERLAGYIEQQSSTRK